MVKTPKKAEVDERNLYPRGLKAVKKSSDSSLPLAQTEKRAKASGLPKMSKVDSKKPMKSKLRTPAKVELGQPTKSASMPISKEDKKLHAVGKTPKSQIPKMKSDLEETDKKCAVEGKKETTEQIESERIENTVTTETQKELNEMNSVKSTENEQGSVEDGVLSKENGQNQNGQADNAQTENAQQEYELNENGAKDNIESEVENGEIKLQYESDEATENHSIISEDMSKYESMIEQSISEVSSETKKVVLEESQTCTIDVMEVTVSDTSEASLTPMDGSNEIENVETNGENSELCNSSAMKDVQIKLDDCLKNQNQDEENNEDFEPLENVNKELSFGRTLRGISGRHSISRMRHITFRDLQQSPNSSMFVNTSDASLPQDANSSKGIRSRFSLLSSSANGSPTDRKRKHDVDESNSAKKPKRESSGILNSSFELLKGFRRPIQESTPYKFETNKIDISTVSNGEEATEENQGSKKWCVVM